MEKYKFLNVKYALINATFMALICATTGYAYNFLSQSGFSDAAAGMIITLVSVCGLIGQPLAGSLIDKSDKLTEKKFITGAMIIAVALAILMTFLPDDSFFLAVVVIIGFTAAAVSLPFFNTMAFIYEKDGRKINYGVCRGFGSLAYAVSSSVVGMIWSSVGKTVLPWWIFTMALLSLIMIRFMPDPEAKNNDEIKEIPSELSFISFFKKYRQMALVALSMALMYFAHMLINIYIAKVLENIMGTSQVEAVQGTALFIAAICELPTMFVIAKLIDRFSINRLMIFASVMYSLKHILTWLCVSVPMFYAVMVLQMFSYAIIVPNSVYFANSCVEPGDRNKAQAVMAVTLTVGTLIASSLGGTLFQMIGVSEVLMIGAAASAAGTVFMILGCGSKAGPNKQ